MNPTSIIPSTIVTFRGKKYPVRMSTAVIIGLKNKGINLMDPGPTDPASIAFAQSQAALTDAIAQGLPEADIEALTAAKEKAWEATTPERKAWRHPLDKTSATEQMEIAFEIGALAISTPRETITAMEIAAELDMIEGMRFAELMYSEVGKFLAPLAGPAVVATPVA
jgi:hypothetical protein